MPTKAKPAPTRAKQEATKPKKLVVRFVWDMSGSMGACHAPTVEGFNQYVMDLKSEEADLIKKHGKGVYTTMSLTVFDTIFEPWYSNVPISEIPTIGMDRYVPRGSTALFDAIAHGITETEEQVRGDEDVRVLFVINTDGYENASVEYNMHQDGLKRIQKLMDTYEAKDNWTFTWLAGTPQAQQQVQYIGSTPAANVMAYAAASPGSTSSSYSGLSAATSTLRSGTSSSTDTFYADAGVSNDATNDSDVPS